MRLFKYRSKTWAQESDQPEAISVATNIAGYAQLEETYYNNANGLPCDIKFYGVIEDFKVLSVTEQAGGWNTAIVSGPDDDSKYLSTLYREGAGKKERRGCLSHRIFWLSIGGDSGSLKF